MNNPRVTVVGYGRVGRALSLALNRARWRVVNVGEHEDSPRVLLAVDEGFRVMPSNHLDLDVDLLVLALPDAEIQAVARLLAVDATERKQDGEREAEGGVRVAMHLSGRFGLSPLQPLSEAGFARLAFHPMQSFPEGAGPERFAGISAGVTADPAAEPLVAALAEALGITTMRVEEGDRIRYHLANVLASNFLPLLQELGAQSLKGIAEDREQALRALWPLMAGMLENLRVMPPEHAMTGPLVRNDLEAVLQHAVVLPAQERSLYFDLIRAMLPLAERAGNLNGEDIKRWLGNLAGGNGRKGETG